MGVFKNRPSSFTSVIWNFGSDIRPLSTSPRLESGDGAELEDREDAGRQAEEVGDEGETS